MPSKNVISVLIFCAVLFGSGIYAFRLHTDDELNVYRSYINSLQPLADLENAAFVGVATDCGFGENDSPNALEAKLIDSNANAIPHALGELKEIAFILRPEIAQSADRSNIALSSLTERPIVSLSRVGFSDDNSKAILCLQSPFMGSVAILEREGLTSWKILNERTVWLR